MAENRSDRTTANRIAKKLNAVYNSGEGPDIISSKATVEVETSETVADAPGQLRGYRGPVYIAGTNHEAVNKAMDITHGTTIGVMDSRGTIIKRSSRK